MAIELAEVLLWGTTIAVVRWDEQVGVADFQYTPEFQNFGIEVAPVVMPVRAAPYRFASLNRDTFKGLPGMLADVLPDKFGNALIDQWLIKQGRSPSDFNPIERLCYTADRAIGALEFKPTQRYFDHDEGSQIELDKMVRLASLVLQKKQFEIDSHDLDGEALEQILQIGTSAGGARAKAIINWNEAENIILPGHVKPQTGFDGWLIKFDGVSENRDKELADPLGYGRIEYAYYLLAQKVGIEMMESRLLEEGSRAHFMTKRFDRVDGDKLHMTSLCGLGHFDFNDPAATSYEQAFVLARQLQIPREHVAQLFKRMVFNVVFRNQDDHTKNIAFLMDRNGHWQLSPAFDVAYSFNPKGLWTSKHQMSVNGKRDEFILSDLLSAGTQTGLSKQRIKQIIEEVVACLQLWPDCAEKAGVKNEIMLSIGNAFRWLD
ncbi:MAG: serine/threonine-protein kinase HipA [Oceanicoccus sp.]|jgi:serine/threonine-protein kinase HipA